MIFTDAQGRPFPKPEPKDFANTTEWLRAYRAWKDQIADCANAAFDTGFRKAIRGARI